MSSSYRILCLSHDPAIELEPEWDGPTGPSGWAEAVALAVNPENDERTIAHMRCDLLVGQYSYPLISICCPPMRDLVKGEFHTGGTWHRSEEWIDLDWLRLLKEAYDLQESGDCGKDPLNGVLTRFERACWTPTRLHRLREFLRLP